MLETSTRPVAQIAWDVGYRDEAAFRKVFRRVVGLAPGAYRLRFRPSGVDGARRTPTGAASTTARSGG
jgi:transcriptional regulator GlxA family with amidase domain